jgi:ABC-type multidrug transport system fused ATPase/permease subunit
LPQGIDTLVGEGGQGLSGGQVQRIAIARALVRDTPWLLLDEPSAHLDPDSERLVTDALARLAQGRTLISIAHRLQTVRDADRIVVLRHGRIVQQGDFAQLAATPGVFRELLDEGDELL